jgi:hypothetical protein
MIAHIIILLCSLLVGAAHAQVLPGSGPGSQQWTSAPRWDGTKKNVGEGVYVPGLDYYTCSNKFDAKYYLYCR